MRAFFGWLLQPEDRYGLAQALVNLFDIKRPQAEDWCGSWRTDREKAVETAKAAGGPPARWIEMAERYGPLVRKDKPRKLLDGLAAGLGLDKNPAVEKLVGASLFYDRMEAFLQNLTLGGEADVSRSGGKTYSADAVTLMTLHGAKGLEFPAVFLCGLRRGALPLETPGRPVDLEEERRLFYVGLTRAKEELVLLAGREPSAFAADLPEALLERGRAAEQKQPYGGKQLSLF
ncbi:MAG: ATP-binding domain-containing protein [Clostridiales bacterium]|nr:ATP-binding domain-containing protein [Clostridiales bacterium]